MTGDIQDALYNIFTNCKGNNLLKVLGSMSAEKIKDIEKLADLVSETEVR